ncbi:MAG: sodium:solute symporter [Kiritimatiellae bacterium]|nr:sodium:solute symporter [Kiritimatiellia bacterium]
MTVKILLSAIFLAIMVAVGVYSRRHSRSVEGFVLGGRNVGPWLTAFAYGTSYFSAVVFVGYAGQFGWRYGLSSTWIGIGNAVIGSLLAWLVLARRTRLMTQRLQSRTMPDFFGSRYGSEQLRVVAAIIAFVFLIPYTAGVYMGIGRLFEMSFNVPYAWCAAVMAILTGVYVILGGYKATAINDFIQGIIMLFGITAVIIAVLSLKGGLVEATHRLGEIASDGNPAVNGGFASLFGPDPRGLVGVVILTSLGTWGLPQMVGKFYSITDESAIRRGTIISTIFAFVVAGGCYFLGGFGRLFEPTLLPNGKIAFDSIIPAMLSTLPNILIALVVLLVLSASMSTLASLVLTSSSTMTLDLIYRDKASLEGEVAAGQIDDSVAEKIERRKVVVMRVLIVFFIALSLMIALHPPHFIAQLMGISWGALAGAFLAPFMLGLYWRGVTKAAVWASFAWGVGITVVNMVSGNTLMNPIDCGAIAMLGGFVVVPAVSLVTRRPPEDVVSRAFGRACEGKAN